MRAAGRGAYGFRLALPPHEMELPHLSALDDDTPVATFVWRHATVLEEHKRIDESCVSLGWRRGSMLEVKRDPASIELVLPEPPTSESLVHPFLATPMSILARWAGDIALHAGGFFAGGKAWAVMGAKGAGKSTTLAQLASRELPLLADDVLVLDDGVVRAGPACIDLRSDVAKFIPGSQFIGEVGNRPRYRLPALPGPSRASLGGIFVLDWRENEGTRIEPVSPGESVRILYENEYFGVLGPAEPKKILDLLEIPMWRVQRPRTSGLSDDVVDRILETTAHCAD